MPENEARVGGEMKINGQQLKQIALATRNGFRTDMVIDPTHKNGYSIVVMICGNVVLMIGPNGNRL